MKNGTGTLGASPRNFLDFNFPLSIMGMKEDR
jgi:hypothetical protein